MSWNVDLGISGYESNVFYNGERVSGIQKIKIITTAEGLTQMELTVKDPKMKIKVVPHDSIIINGKRVKLKTCPSCIEAGRIEKRIIERGW